MKIEIYVAGHKDSTQIPGETFIPIHVGRNGATASFCNIGDDTGDNISSKNDTFCELTALYWIWKNTSGQDYVGLFHYRRHMNLSFNAEEENKWGVVEYDRIDDNYIDINQLMSTGAVNCVDRYDIVLPKEWDVTNAGSISMYDHFDNGPDHNIADYDKALAILKKSDPSYSPFIHKVNKSTSGYFTNMFIMKRDLFDNYCDWLFNILFSLEKKLDISGYSVQERRIFGFISEWLFNIYIEKLRFDQPSLKIKTAQRTFIKDTTPRPNPVPYYSSNFTAIVMAFNDGFTPYAGTALRSIADTANPQHNYDIILFDGAISERNKILIMRSVQSFQNIHIRFINPNAIFNTLVLPTHLHITKDTYYRLLIPEIFTNYQRIIYLDGDMIIKNDVSLLNEISMENRSIAAVRDCVMTGFRKFQTKSIPDGLETEIYLKTRLGMRDPSSYFQAGVIVYNIGKSKQKINTIKEILASGEQYWFMDQDILNKVYQDDVIYLDSRWNVFHGNGNTKTFFESLPAASRDEYFSSRKDPFIIHYAGEKKPWIVADIDFAEDFWSAARSTPWYEGMLFQLLHPKDELQQIRNEIGMRDICRAIANPFAPIGSWRRRVLRSVYHIIKRAFAR
ncbi:DUF4422 domain-containing protein [Brucella pituitosa]|uniref:DUF4422 domain-containing protein n=1 Tax=Brucella pituitosa TaxID=571256 RepID=UPI003C735C25